ncbi:MAG: PKD domain-containing protein [Bacteroidales bacterium]|nr:PKD domain-containing protein [Bacteroidales bacterium]
MKQLLLLLVVIIFSFTQSIGQGNMITVTTQLPPSITVCGPSQNIDVNIYNPSPFSLSNVKLSIVMPVGLSYVPGSITGATQFNISNLNQPVFALTGIAPQTGKQISFTITASCDLGTYISDGNLVSVVSKVDYTTNTNITTFDQNISYLYFVKQPNLSIINVSNQTYSGNIGDIFTRCITITNGGFGELSQFTYRHTHGTGIQINNVTIGTWSNSGNIETIQFTGADFATIGNHNNLFENAEVITICETIEILNCVSVFSDYEVEWGCNGVICQSSMTTANVIFPNFTPNLEILATPHFNTCLGIGNANNQTIRIINKGQGTAYEILLDIFQTTGTTFTTGMRSNIDMNSFTIQLNSSAAQSITPSQTFATSSIYCLTANPRGRAILNLPPIQSNDTLYVRWNSYNCCSNVCGGNRDIAGWSFKGSYKSICEDSYVIPITVGYSYRQIYGQLINDLSPSYISTGETKNFSFVFSSYANSYPSTTGRYWKMVVVLPPCLTYTGDFKIERYNGSQFWLPTSVNVTGNTLTAIFNGNPPWSLYQAIVKFNLTANCANPSCVEGENTISIQSSFIPDGSCPCEVAVSCQTVKVGVVCPITCEGLNNKSFDVRRISYGLPDNNNDGLPDAIPATLDFNKIRTDRVLFGDTVQTVFNSVIKTGTNNPNWSYFYATSSVSNGIRFSYLNAELKIYQNSSGNIYTCNVFTPTVTNAGSTRNFSFDLSVQQLVAQGCVPMGFVFNDNDSVSFAVKYKVTSNIGDAIVDCFFNSTTYLSNIPNPTSSINKFYCNDYDGRVTLVGYYFTNWGPNNVNVNTCNTVTINQNYYLSIGPCCQNYSGGNLFPFEYRNWAHIDSLTVIVPTGYQFVSAQFNHIRTAGTNGTSTSSWIPIMPVNQYSDTLLFLVEPYFESYGGTIPLSDDGFYGTLQVTLIPTCDVVQNTASNVVYKWEYAITDYLQNSNTSNLSNVSTHDFITYQGPDIFLQSNLPSVLAFDDEVEWIVTLSNTTNIDALHTWFAGENVPGIIFLEVYDLDFSSIINPVGDIYQIGTLAANTIRSFRIKASYTSCYPASVIIHSGWNCNAGYPVTITDYPCTTKKLQLSLAPQIPNLIANITSPITTVDLCDTTSYLVEGINVQLGTAYNLKLKVLLPLGVTIISGSSQISYPEGSPFINIANPVNIGGTLWQYDISAISALIGADGLKGILDTNYNNVKITFKVITDCAYTSGSVIGFNFHGQSHCGLATGQEISMSSELAITGATEPYLTNIELNTSYLSPCSDNNTTLRIKIINNGPLFFGQTDSVVVQLPEGILFQPNSFSPVYNPPPHSVPSSYFLNNYQYLIWKLPELTPAGDSVIFEFNYYGIPTELNCGIYTIEVNTFSSRNLLCQLIGQSCGIKVNTGTQQAPIYIYQAFLSVDSAYGYALPNPTAGETVWIDYSITNIGEFIDSLHNLYIKFYYDADNNGILSASDLLVYTETQNLDFYTDSTYSFSSQFNVNAGNSCNFIVYIDTALNNCVCNPSVFALNVPLYNAGDDKIICGGQSVSIGTPAISGYTYSWQPVTGLNSAVISSPVLTLNNPGNANDTVYYVLTTNRISCISKDTVQIIIYPLPNADAGPDDTICTGASVVLTASGGISYLWSNNAATAVTNVSPTITTTYTVTVTDSNSCSKTDNVKILVNSLPPVNAGVNVEICRNDSIQFSASGALSYIWNNDSTLTLNNISNPIAFPHQTTTYTVTGTDLNGCSNTSNVVVTVNNNPLLTETLQNISCYGFDDGSITVNPYNALFPYTYIWSTSPVQTTQTATGLQPGITYTVTVTDDNGCSATDNYVLTQPTQLQMTFTASDALCFNSCDGQAEVIATGGTTPYSYTWSPTGTGGNFSSLNTLCAGTYQMQLKDSNNCELDTNFTINHPEQISFSHTQTEVNCFDGNDGDITLNVHGGTLPYSYVWTPNVSTDSFALNLIAGTYQIAISDAHQCDTSLQIIISQPTLLEIFNSGNDTVCIGESYDFYAWANGGVQPYVFSWDNSLGTGDTLTQIGTITTNYQVFVTDSHNCVSDTIGLEVFVYPVVNVDAFYAGDSAICLNNSTQIGATAGGGNNGPYTYTWNNGIGVQNPPIQVSPTVTTQYTVTAGDNCGSPVATDTITIIVNPLPDVEFSAVNTEGCQPLLVEFTDLSSPDIEQWQWFFGDMLSGIDNTSNLQNPSHLYLNSGTYHVTLNVTTIHGCQGLATQTNFVNVYALPIADFMYNPPFADIENPYINFENQSTGEVKWIWNFGDDGNASSSNEESPVHFYAEPGIYTVLLIVESAFGCLDSTTKEILYRPEYTFYIPSAFSPNSDGLNDTFGPLGLGFDMDDFEMHIYDRWGKLVFKTNDINHHWDGKVTGSDNYALVGVYSWVIFYTKTADFDKHINRHTGHVTLLR